MSAFVPRSGERGFGAVAVGVGVVLYYGGQFAQAVVQVALAFIPAAIFLQAAQRPHAPRPQQEAGHVRQPGAGLTCGLAAAALAILVLERCFPEHSDLVGFRIALTLVADLAGIGLAIATLRLAHPGAADAARHLLLSSSNGPGALTSAPIACLALRPHNAKQCGPGHWALFP